MTPERFQDLADAFGADLRRWPDEERFAAELFARNDARGKAILAEVAAFDELLSLAPAPAPSVSLKDRLLALAPRQVQPLWRRGGAWISGAGMAAACVLGVLVGANASQSFLSDPSLDTVVEASTAFDGEGYVAELENAG